MYQVDVASSVDAASVTELRRTALAQSREFSVNDIDKVGWTEIDESSVVLVVREDDILVSSMRMITFSDEAAAERFLEYPVTQHSIPGPILTMSRAVTLPSHFSKGLMGAIRYAYLRGALETAIQSVVAIVYQGAPRVNSMRRAGFEMLECRQHWDSEATVSAAPLIGVLPRRLFSQALAHSQAEFSHVIDDCAFNWDAIHQRFAHAPTLSR
jgi:hypothetical protein